MAEFAEGEPVSTAMVSLKSIFSELLDSTIEGKVESAVSRILMEDGRFVNPDIETVDAIRDWVRAEAVLSKAFHNFMLGGSESTSSNERMFRSAMIQKNALRDEIFGRFRGKKAKKEEIDFATKILVDTGVIEPKTEVDILETDE